MITSKFSFTITVCITYSYYDSKEEIIVLAPTLILLALNEIAVPTEEQNQ